MWQLEPRHLEGFHHNVHHKVQLNFDARLFRSVVKEFSENLLFIPFILCFVSGSSGKISISCVLWIKRFYSAGFLPPRRKNIFSAPPVLNWCETDYIWNAWYIKCSQDIYVANNWCGYSLRVVRIPGHKVGHSKMEALNWCEGSLKSFKDLVGVLVP